MRMYILLKRSLPNAFAPVVAAHAALACFRKFETQPDMQTWINGVFKKVVCVVSDAEFEHAKNTPDYVIITESALQNMEVGIAFCPRAEYPKGFKFYKMWSPSSEIIP
jgi:peptidyl-tRNA hydrolase